MTINDLTDPDNNNEETTEGFPANLKIILGIIGVLVVLVVAGLLLFPKTRPASTSATSTQAVAEVVQTVIPTLSIQTSAVSSGPASCQPVTLLPTANPTEESLYPPVSESDWVQGDATAAVTFLEYSEFQCPYCAMLEPVLLQLVEDYPQEVRHVFRHFPLLEIHPNALLAAQAAESAGRQDKDLFFVMGERLFTNQSVWAPMSTDDFKDWLITQAETLELDIAQFTADLDSPEIAKIAQDAHDEGVRIGIPGTPFLLVNGVPHNGPRDYASLEAIIKLFRLQERQYEQCPPMTLGADIQYQAALHTSKGDIVIKLFADKAPVTVNSFVFLARNGWYDDVPFHRVIPGFVAQTGDPTGSGYGGPGYAFGNEIDPSLTFDKNGVVGMFNAGADSNGSQFFITMDAVPDLDGIYTIFGQVTEGLEVLENLTPVDSTQNTPIPDADMILTISIEEK